jgi:hypothetical protein
MRIGSLPEAASKLEVTRLQLERLVSQGTLHVLRGDHPKAAVFVMDEALRAAWFEPPAHFGEPSAETLIREVVDRWLAELLQAIADEDKESQESKIRLRALESLHTYRGGTAHCLPPQAS